MRRITVMAVGLLAALTSACLGGPPESERFPTSADYPPGVMERFTYVSPSPAPWRLSALRSAPHDEARWRVVVISGTPSWSEYWAPTIAAAPHAFEVIVADRPGFGPSEPERAVTRLEDQAAAMAPLLSSTDGRGVILVGQSYGAPIAAMMAAQHPQTVRGLILVSPFFGERGRTARTLMGLGGVARPLLGRDLRNSLQEVAEQAPQLPAALEALRAVRAPVTIVQGGEDTFVSAAANEELAQSVGARFVSVPEGDHFLNACCVPNLIAAFEAAAQAATADQSAVAQAPASSALP